MSTRKPLAALVVACAVALGHIAYLHKTLPVRVASHFDASGHPNAWASRSSFLGIYLGVIALLTVIGLGSGWLIAKLPSSMINLPNKDYWLDPARRDGSIAWIRGWSQTVAAGSIALLFAVMRLAARVSLGEARTLGDASQHLLVLFFLFISGMALAMLIRFGRSGRADGAAPPRR